MIDHGMRTALITGAGTGLGRELALVHARRGVAVTVGYGHSRDAAHAVVEEIRASGGRAIAAHCDVSNAESVIAARDAALEAHGPIDILINNAGVTRAVPLDDLDAADDAIWREVLDVNLLGAVRTIRALSPGMRRGGGTILNIASNSAVTGDGSSMPYVVSKAALVSLTQSLARALAPRICVNALAPGWMRTAWLERNLPESLRTAEAEGRLPLVPVSDVAEAGWSLTSNLSITGHVLVVDRGESLGIEAP